MSERLLRDIHPAEVYAPHHGMTAPATARVFITSTRIQAWAEASPHPRMLFEAPTTSSPEPERGTLFGALVIDTEAGQVFVNRGKGCGCHSPLKALMAPANWS